MTALRYGGLRLYRRALPLFLILGDFVLGSLWPLVGWALQIPYYSFQQ